MRFSCRNPSFVFLIAAFTMIVACAPPPPIFPETAEEPPAPPTQQELAGGRNAVSPPSKQAAQKAAMDHINNSLKDPYSAQYKFYNPVNSHHIGDGIRQFGWFICGVVNAKNSYGGYTGDSFFVAYFDPIDGTRVIDGAIESGDYQFVESMCVKIYRLAGFHIPLR